ncbi:MAG: hypothetical protein ACLUFV_05185 [Acutalibacteraceae bacterium]
MERILTVLENTPLAPGVFRLLLDGAEADDVRAPGQFFNLSVDGFYLRRPISVCDAAGSRVTLIYKVVGAGTRSCRLPPRPDAARAHRAGQRLRPDRNGVAPAAARRRRGRAADVPAGQGAARARRPADGGARLQHRIRGVLQSRV